MRHINEIFDPSRFFMLLVYLPEWVQKFKEPRTEIKKVGGHFYKYQVKYCYNKQKKRTGKVTVGLLGKITEEDGFVLSGKNMLKQQAERSVDPSKVDIRMLGVFGLFSELLEEEIRGLSCVFDPGSLEVLLTVVMMRFAHEAPIKRMQRLHRHDCCSLHWHKGGAPTDKMITTTLRHVGENRGLILDWMKSRLTDSSEGTLDEYVMIDSTHVTTTSNLLDINAPGYNPAKNFDEQVRLMYMFSSGLKQPVHYRLINENITDVSSMKLCMEEMKTDNVIFIADKGFHSKLNVKILNDNKLKYIILLYRNNSLIDFTPLGHPGFKKENPFFIYGNRVIWYYAYMKEGQRFITFLDEKLHTEEERDYILRMGTHPEKYTKDGFDEKLHTFGTLTLTTNAGVDAWEFYEKYKQRNEIEVMFDSYRNFLKADRMYMQDRIVLEGWLMANFLAMIAYYKLYRKLVEAKKLNNYSLRDIVEISKLISRININGQWHTTETTNKTKDLFKILKIDYLTERS